MENNWQFPHRRWNPLRREWVIVSPHRTQRPWQGQTEETAVATAKSYDFEVSTTGMFNHIVMARKTTATSVDISGLDPGDYFWRVRAVDDANSVSDSSDSYKFTLVVQGKEQDMLLAVDDTELQGNVVEVIGRTEPGAALIINGASVADIKPDGHFRYFTDPMTRGSHTIVITGQNRRGGTAIKRVDVVIP